MRRSRTHASNTGTPTKITRITDYFGQPQITPKKKKPEGNHITNYFKRANSEDKDETSNEKRPRISLGVIDDDTDHIEHIHVDNHDIVLDTERSVPSTPSSRNNVVLIDLDEDDRELSSSMPLELSSDDDEPEDGLTLLDITPSKSAVRLSTRARSPPTSPTIASRLRRQPAVSYKIDMSLIDSDDVKEKYDFSLSRLLEDKQTRAKLRKEESNTQILALQSDSTSIINELDTDVLPRDPRIAQLLERDNDAIKDWVFTFFTNTVDMNSEQYQRETRQAMKVLASESPLSIDSQEQLETMLLDGVLAQLEGVGFVYPEEILPWLLYTMCCHSNAQLALKAWQLFELLAPQYNFRSWLSEGIIENILTINGASKSYLHKELMLSMVDLIRAPSTETLPQGIGYLLRAYPMIISRQEPPVIYHHFSLLLRIALDKRTIQWQPHIHQCIIATKRILNDCAIGDWKQSLLNYLWKHHDFTPVIIKLLNSLPALCLDLIQFRRELAEYYLVRMMNLPESSIDLTNEEAEDEEEEDDANETCFIIEENTFVKRLIVAIEQHWMNGTALSDFRQVEIKLRLIDYTLDYDTIQQTKKSAIKSLMNNLQYLHGSIVEHPSSSMERSRVKDLLLHICAKIRFARSLEPSYTPPIQQYFDPTGIDGLGVRDELEEEEVADWDIY